MADREGQVTMADRPVKSLVSEQYLDGWSYGDEEDSDDSELPAPPSTNKQTNPVTVSSCQNKRPHSEAEETGDNSKPVEKKKFCMSLGSKADGEALSVPPPPPPVPSLKPSKTADTAPSIKKISMNVGQLASKVKAAPIKMSLSAQSKPKPKETVVAAKTNALARAFGDDSDESEEEMPAEARMRMRNIGRETPTAAGPNSFGKSRLGFCDRQKIIERELQKNADD